MSVTTTIFGLYKIGVGAFVKKKKHENELSGPNKMQVHTYDKYKLYS